MSEKAFQDYFPDHLSHCYGCGRLNEHGFQIKSHWDGDEAICIFNPEQHHIAVPGYVYGGLIASVIDCHCACTAMAVSYRNEGRELGTEPLIIYLTASLHVDYLRPTPLGIPLIFRASVEEMKGRKARVSATLSAEEEVCARGNIVVVRAPEHLVPE
ncbi:MAG: PaaI family thioesterase [Dehalococcoidia bacterium]|nr:MAG: PaaI family thioesterase [Dehalococcoidia bacterium]UCG83933.1 MAG: PaaI family thioesterase [Dehalococcoidia bacterium]